MRCKTALKIVSLVLVLVSIISMVAPNTVTAMVSQKEYRSRLEVRNLFGVLVGYAIAGHVITIDTNQNRIVRATAGSLGAYPTAWLWNADWGNPWWSYSTAPGNSYGVVKIWFKIYSPIWCLEGDLYNYVEYYGGTTVYVHTVFIGTAGNGRAKSDTINIAINLGPLVELVLS
ncbi:MAG: hypothetical protein QW747_01375 [Ignisphaera sp.]